MADRPFRFTPLDFTRVADRLKAEPPTSSVREQAEELFEESRYAHWRAQFADEDGGAGLARRSKPHKRRGRTHGGAAMPQPEPSGPEDEEGPDVDGEQSPTVPAEAGPRPKTAPHPSSMARVPGAAAERHRSGLELKATSERELYNFERYEPRPKTAPAQGFEWMSSASVHSVDDHSTIMSPTSAGHHSPRHGGLSKGKHRIGTRITLMVNESTEMSDMSGVDFSLLSPSGYGASRLRGGKNGDGFEQNWRDLAAAWKDPNAGKSVAIRHEEIQRQRDAEQRKRDIALPSPVRGRTRVSTYLPRWEIDGKPKIESTTPVHNGVKRRPPLENPGAQRRVITEWRVGTYFPTEGPPP